MSETGSARPAGEHYDLAMDAFLFAGTSWLALTLLVEGVGQWLLGPTPPDWAQLLNVPMMIVPVAGGVLAAWWAHRRIFEWRTVLGAVAGVAIGIPVAGAGLVGASMLASGVMAGAGPGQARDQAQGPWALIALLGVAVLALVAPVVVRSIADLSPSRSLHRGLDVARLATIAVAAVLALVAGPAIASVLDPEIAEAGIFAVIFAVAGALGAMGADAVWTWQRREHGRTGAPAVPA